MLRSLARRRSPLLAVAAPAAAAAHDAEIFATNNTAADHRPSTTRGSTTASTGFARRVERIVHDGGGRPRGSELLDGVFCPPRRARRSSARAASTSTASTTPSCTTSPRRPAPLPAGVRAHVRPPAPGDRDVDAVELDVPGVSAQALREGLLADPEARERLFGGSVTLDRPPAARRRRAPTPSFARASPSGSAATSSARRHALRRPRVRRGRDRRPRPDREAHAA